MEKIIKFDFYGIGVEVSSSWSELIEKIEWDFSFFKADEIHNIHFSLKVEDSGELTSMMANKSFEYNSEKVSFFTVGRERFCRYPSGAHSKIDFQKNIAVVEASDIDAAHELVYLLILSRVGKKLDLKGLHRVHAGSIIYNRKLCLFAMSSGVGKTTLISHLLDIDDEVKLISDDSPLVDGEGNIYPFPIRFGFEENAIIPDSFQKLPSYELRRHHFGKKKLISLKNVRNGIGAEYDSCILFAGSRGESFHVRAGSFLALGKHLIREALIGYGLPILFEYFWEPGIKDFFVKSEIAIRRTKALIFLYLRSKKFGLTIGNYSKPDRNAKLLIERLD